MSVEYTLFQGRAGDHNDLAIPGACALGEALARRTGVQPTVIGKPERALNVGWRDELDAATPALRDLQTRLDSVFSRGSASIAAISRCAVSLATLPIVAKHHSSVCILWLDAHADLNTPEVTMTGYLGGLAFGAPVGLWRSGLGDGLRLDQVVLLGQRDLDPFERDLIACHDIPLIKPSEDLVAGLRKAIAGRPVYVHLDCDVLHPGIVPTDYVLEGGLSLEDLRSCCKVIAEHEFVGLEIAEFQNSWTQDGEAVSPEPLLTALEPILVR